MVIEYLGRYTHKLAIRNHRIHSINEENGTVIFGYKDYSDGDKQKQMTITIAEFIRRFEQHILPARFPKIRNYGYLANRNRLSRVAGTYLFELTVTDSGGLSDTDTSMVESNRAISH